MNAHLTIHQMIATIKYRDVTNLNDVFYKLLHKNFMRTICNPPLGKQVKI